MSERKDRGSTTGSPQAEVCILTIRGGHACDGKNRVNIAVAHIGSCLGGIKRSFLRITFLFSMELVFYLIERDRFLGQITYNLVQLVSLPLPLHGLIPCSLSNFKFFLFNQIILPRSRTPAPD